jgi:serine/threonine protein kinase
MHQYNIIHRDLKPDNILLNSRESSINDVRIADLGFAIIVKEKK